MKNIRLGMGLLALAVGLPAPAIGQEGPHPGLAAVLEKVQSLHDGAEIAVVVDGRLPTDPDRPGILVSESANREFARLHELPATTSDDLLICPGTSQRGCHLRGDISVGVSFLVDRERSEEADVLVMVQSEQLDLERIPIGVRVYRAVLREMERGWEIVDFELVWMS
ncbi:hypothetical protein [Gaopeijia maritima]|uniref:Uncharacterized protein n=1 Tax=Gaopeijia maritima TaxID=3119007 RepID=A0ABU9E4A3_9BACT